MIDDHRRRGRAAGCADRRRGGTPLMLAEPEEPAGDEDEPDQRENQALHCAADGVAAERGSAPPARLPCKTRSSAASPSCRRGTLPAPISPPRIMPISMPGTM